MLRQSEFPSVLLALGLACSLAAVGGAQTTGYISGYLNQDYSFIGFSSATGAFAGPIPESLGRGTQFVVSGDGSSFYVPATVGQTGQTGALDTVSSVTGQVLQSTALEYPALKVLLSNDQSTAYVLTQLAGAPGKGAVEVVDLSSGSVTGTIGLSSPNSTLQDIALSPDGTKLFVSILCNTFGGCQAQQRPPCTVGQGICIYDPSSLNFLGQVNRLAGLMAVSQNGSSLYVATDYAEQPGPFLYVVNTQTLAESEIRLNASILGPPVMDPKGDFGLLFTETVPGSGAAYVLNTQTNKIVKVFWPSPPNGSYVQSESYGLQSLASFAPGGGAVWAFLQCLAGTSCSFTGGATQVLAGFEFPSGALIAETPVPNVDPSTYHVSLAFPQATPAAKH